jgi:RNA polymerase sigma factor (sigma-70 family)
MSISENLLHQETATLYRDHHSWLQSWLRRQLGNTWDAADIAQDTFMRVLTKPATTGLREPRAYLTFIARHLMIDFFRRADLERAYLADLATLDEQCQPSPEERLSVLQSLQALDRMLDGLTLKTRTAWLLSRLDGLTHKEIAGQLRVSVPRVRQYLASAARHAYMCQFDSEGTVRDET